MANLKRTRNEAFTCDSCGAIDLTVRPSWRSTNRGAVCRTCRRK